MKDESEVYSISEISIQNYKSINNANVKLLPGMNIIIGKNGAGKSNLLQFINRYSSLRNVVNSRMVRTIKTNFKITYSKELENKKLDTLLVSFEKKLEKIDPDEIETINILEAERTLDKVLNYEFKITFHDKIRAEEKLKLRKFTATLESLKLPNKRFISFNLPEADDLTWLIIPAKLRYSNDSGVDITSFSYFDFLNGYEFQMDNFLVNKISKLPLDDTEGIKQVILDSFYDYSHKINIITQIQSYTPIEDIRLNPNVNIYLQDSYLMVENLIIDFLISGSWVPWNYLSDGTKRLFLIVSECSSIDDAILLIEEPELGIHPSQLYQLMEFLRKKSFNNQVIISTHSPLALNILKPKELDRIVIAKMTNAGTKFFKLSKEKIKKAVKYIEQIGDLSYYWLHSDLEDD